MFETAREPQDPSHDGLCIDVRLQREGFIEISYHAVETPGGRPGPVDDVTDTVEPDIRRTALNGIQGSSPAAPLRRCEAARAGIDIRSDTKSTSGSRLADTHTVTGLQPARRLPPYAEVALGLPGAGRDRDLPWRVREGEDLERDLWNGADVR